MRRVELVSQLRLRRRVRRALDRGLPARRRRRQGPVHARSAPDPQPRRRRRVSDRRARGRRASAGRGGDQGVPPAPDRLRRPSARTRSTRPFARSASGWTPATAPTSTAEPAGSARPPSRRRSSRRTGASTSRMRWSTSSRASAAPIRCPISATICAAGGRRAPRRRSYSAARRRNPGSSSIRCSGSFGTSATWTRRACVVTCSSSGRSRPPAVAPWSSNRRAAGITRAS